MSASFTYDHTGIVQRGDGRGRQLSFPTANVTITDGTDLPDHGVYAGLATTERGATHPAAISLGRRSTFYAHGVIQLEVHLLDFDGELYGTPLGVRFGPKVRDQRRFESVEDLVAQLQHDVAEVRRLLVTDDKMVTQRDGLVTMSGEQPSLRQLELDDKQRLVRLYHRCSEATIYRRFFSPPPPEPPDFILDWLLAVDHSMREAIAATHGDEIVGVARFDRDTDEPTTAEFAVLVEDDWQRRGVARRLMVELARTARKSGVTTLYGVTQADNVGLVNLVKSLSERIESTFEDGLIRISFRVD